VFLSYQDGGVCETGSCAIRRGLARSPWRREWLGYVYSVSGHFVGCAAIQHLFDVSPAGTLLYPFGVCGLSHRASVRVGVAEYNFTLGVMWVAMNISLCWTEMAAYFAGIRRFVSTNLTSQYLPQIHTPSFTPQCASSLARLLWPSSRSTTLRLSLVAAFLTGATRWCKYHPAPHSCRHSMM
jgi:hypothetical protein